MAQKNNSRQALVDIMHNVGYYVLYIAQGDRFIALKSGLTLSKEPAPVVIAKPSDLKVENSDQSGELLVSVKKVKGAAAYMHQYSKDPLLKEESWMGMLCTATKCKIEGLTPGTTYYLRVGAVGGNDQVMFSDVGSRIAA